MVQRPSSSSPSKINNPNSDGRHLNFSSALSLDRAVNESKQMLKSLKGAAILKDEVGNHISEGIHFYFQLKDDTRRFIIFQDQYCDVKAGSTIKRPKFNDYNVPLDNILYEYEERFMYREGTSNEALITLLHELHEYRAEIESNICSDFLNKLGIDQISYYTAPNTDEKESKNVSTTEILHNYSTNKVQTLLNFFLTFTTIEKKIKKTSLISDASKTNAKGIMEKQLIIEQLKASLEIANKEIADYQVTLKNLANSSQRHQIMVKKQEQLDDLERSNAAMEKQLKVINAEKNQMKSTISQLSENLVAVKSQLQHSKAAYTRDLEHFQPIVRDITVHKLEANKVASAAKEEALIGFERSKLMERINEKLQDEINKLTASNEALSQEVDRLHRQCKRVIDDRERLERINLILTAAKVKYHDLSIEKEKEIKSLSKDKFKLETAFREHLKQKDDGILYTKELERQVKELTENLHAANEKATINATYNAALELQYKDMKDEIDAFKILGCTPEMKEIMDDKDKHIIKLELNVDRMKKEVEKSIRTISGKLVSFNFNNIKQCIINIF